MPESHTGSSRQPMAFICTPYVPGPDGRLIAEMPDRCPARACGTCDKTDCVLRTEYYRQRKTGPAHPLAVVRCRTHGTVFTLYPPGYAPHQRQSVLRLSYDGSGVFQEKGRNVERADFGGTVFESALNTRDHPAKERADITTDSPMRRGSRRHLRLAARITGVARELTERIRVSIAMALSVDCLGLQEGARATDYRAIGAAIRSVLAKLKGGARRARDLLTCGALVSCWGEPLHWVARRRVLERASFPIPGTPTSLGGTGFSSLPTKV